MLYPYFIFKLPTLTSHLCYLSLLHIYAIYPYFIFMLYPYFIFTLYPYFILMFLILTSYLCYLYFTSTYMHNNHCHWVTAHLQSNYIIYYYYVEETNVMNSVSQN